MSPDKPHEANLNFVFKKNNQPILITANIKNNPAITYGVSIFEKCRNIIWRKPDTLSYCFVPVY